MNVAPDFDATDQRRARDDVTRPTSTVSRLYQSEWWYPKDQVAVHISDMDDTWRLNAARFMERQAPVLANLYARSFYLGLALDRDDSLGDLQDIEQAERNPLRWVQELPLYRALLAGLPYGGSALASLRERARHWSTCAARLSSEATCDCTPAPAPPKLPDGWGRAFLDIGRPGGRPRTVAPAARCTGLAGCLVHPNIHSIHNPNAAHLADSDIDPSTDRPWGVDENGFDHQEPHDTNDDCRFDHCSGCYGYHCAWYCAEMDFTRAPSESS